MKSALFAVLFYVLLTTNAFPQSSLRIHPSLAVPADTATHRALVQSVGEFLVAVREANEQNKWVLESQAAETFVLLDEIRGCEKSAKYKDDFFYKPVLTNVVSLPGGPFFIQVSYLGSVETNPVLRASFSFLAHQTPRGFRFSSALTRATERWKRAAIGGVTFYFPHTLDKRQARKFSNLCTMYDKKLGAKANITEFYCAGDRPSLQQLVGVDYKSDYNGRNVGTWSAAHSNKLVVVHGNSQANLFDTHDLWHERLALVADRSTLCRPVDEGCAYLYGGSWGLPWAEIFKEFKTQVAINTNISWMGIKDTPVYFKTGVFNNSADNIVNALLVREIERIHGFSGVWQLLRVGPTDPGQEKYFQTLSTLLGITKENYNVKIWELVRRER